MSITSKGKRWELLHSLWIGWTFTLGFFNWIAFLYIGVRANRKRWLLWGVFYSIPFVLAMALPNLDGWPGDLVVALTLILGVIGIVHAFRIRKEYLNRLVMLQDRLGENGGSPGNRQAASQPSPGDQKSEERERLEEVEHRRASSNRDKGGIASAKEENASASTHTPEAESSKDTVSKRGTSLPEWNPNPKQEEREVNQGNGRGSSRVIRDVPQHYPLPLSYSYHLVETEIETLRILKEIYRNAEGLMAFLSSLSLSLAKQPPGKVRKKLLNSRGATFGSWYMTFKDTTSSLDGDTGTLHRSMKELLGGEEDTTFAHNMKWLIDSRNDLHHRDLPVGQETDLLIDESHKRLGECIQEASVLFEHNPLRLVLDYDAIRNSEKVIATCLDYSGDHPAGRKVKEEYLGVPKKQDLYILQNGKDWISLYPFISIQYCRHCSARETYFIDGWTGSSEEASLRSFERAHDETSEEVGRDLASILEAKD